MPDQSITVLVPLSKGKFALIDIADADAILAHKWYAHSGGYACRDEWDGVRKRKTCILMHRQLMDAPKGTEVDHINLNRLDNRRGNLRLCTRVQNTMNRPVRRDSRSGYRGVQLRESGSFQAVIKVRGKAICLGTYRTAEEAARAYDAAAIELYGEFAWINLPHDLPRET